MDRYDSRDVRRQAERAGDLISRRVDAPVSARDNHDRSAAGHPQLTRRDCLAVLAASGWGLSAARLCAADQPHSAASAPVISAADGLAKLREGNRRFVEGRSQHEHATREWRNRLVAEQHPFAAIVGCSDSRVPIELIFDQGFGDLFVIRNAGNLAATDVLASVEYAVLHLHTRLVVIMGHDHCGAVTAALQARGAREREPMELQAVLRMIDVSTTEVDRKGDPRELVNVAVEANVRWGVKQLRFLAAERGGPAFATAQMVGSVYDLQTGRVRFLD